MDSSTIEVARSGPVATVWLKRAAVHNALDEAMIAALTEAFLGLASDRTVRVVVLAGHGKSFCAGADVEWMKRQGAAAFADNAADARLLAQLFQSIATLPQLTIAHVHGAALGGGVGLVAACDVAIASEGAVFGMSEVRLGLIPATIGPYVVRAIGERNARRLFVTGGRFGAAEALRIGLLTQVVEAAKLDDAVQAVVAEVMLGAPMAQIAAKRFVGEVAGRPVTDDLMKMTAQTIATLRAADEAREGLSAFLNKRPAAWIERVSGSNV